MSTSTVIPTHSSRLARLLFLLPLLGFVTYIPDAVIGHPNLIWAGLLFAWTLAATVFAWWLLRPDSAWLLETLDGNASRVAVAAIGSAALLFISWNVYQAYHFAAGTPAEDTAYYSQILWNTLHGNFLSGNLVQELKYSPPVTSDLALHVSPALLVLLLPAYAVFPHFLTLLIIRDLTITLAAWPLFLLARERLGGSAGVAAVLLYLANPVIIGQGTDAFYPLQLAPLPFCWALRAFTRQEFGTFFFWMVLVLATREDAAIMCAGFGLWALARRRSFRWWCVGLGIPVLWWGFATGVIQPAFGTWHRGGFQAALAGGGTTPLASYRILLTQPFWIVVTLREGGLLFLHRLFRSVAFLPALGSEVLLCVPVLTAILFLRRVVYGIFDDPFSHIALLPSCALVGTTLVIVSRMSRKYHGDARVFAAIMLFLLPSASLLDGSKSALQLRLWYNSVKNDAQALREAIRLIPQTASVAACNYALPALSKRRKLYHLVYIHQPVAAADNEQPGTQGQTKGWYFGVYPNPQPEYVLLDRNLDRIVSNPELRRRYVATLEELSHSAEYETIWQKGEYSLLRRKKTTPAV